MSLKTTKPINEEKTRNRDEVLQRVFDKSYKSGAAEVLFTMDEIRQAIANVASARPGYKENNVADVRYQYTSGRHPLPEAIDRHGPWMIVGRGKARYAFVRLAASPTIDIQDDLLPILLPSATPEIVLEYAGGDEQGLLAKVHYNRPLQECSGSFSLSGIKVQSTQMEEDVRLETLFVPIAKGLFDQPLDFIV